MLTTALRVQSAVCGRIRYDMASVLWRQPERASVVEEALARLPGIRSTVANPLTGSLLVYYDPHLTGVELESLVLDVFASLAEQPASLAEQPDTSRPVQKHAPLQLPDQVAANGQQHTNGHGHDHSSESLQTQIRNLFVGGSVLVGLLAINLLPGMGFLAGHPLTLAFTSLATLVSGYSFFRGAWHSLTNRGSLTTDALVSSATLASLALGESGTALIVIWLLNLGGYLEARMLQRARRAIRALLEEEKKEVWVISGDAEIARPVTAVQIGDVIAVHAGERLLVDGEVIAGSGTLNEAPISGESMPVIRSLGDNVYAGSLLLAGELKIRVLHVGAETAIGRLIERVEEAEELRAPIHTTGERFSALLVPASFVLAGGVFVITGEAYRALTMLLVACPCAAGLATPTAVSAAIGNGARRGILIKGGTHLEALAQVDTIAFDKTGTLTIGVPAVERIISLDSDYSAEQLLSLAASGELHSQHPLALAVSDHARTREVVIPSHETCEIHIGRGVHADWEGNCVLVGSQQLLTQFNVDVPSQAKDLNTRHSTAGETVMYVTHQSRVIGLIGVRDKLRPDAASTVAQLRANGVTHLLMFTGDTKESASPVARSVGLTEWYAGLLPDEKYDLIRRIRAEGYRVAVVGDGINDAPALALADVGIAMGSAGSDIAVEAADIALAGNNIRHVASTVALSRRALRTIRQNYAIAVGVNVGGIMVSALGAINPFIAAALHNLSTLLVVLNSSRLLTYVPDSSSTAA
jgi:manganese/zinc-transporting P-type ATPase C